jgi:hypothetical protein
MILTDGMADSKFNYLVTLESVKHPGVRGHMNAPLIEDISSFLSWGPDECKG